MGKALKKITYAFDKDQKTNKKNQLKNQEKNKKSKKSRTPFFQVLYPSRKNA